MSLHAQLSPEAIARLQAQRRNNSIGSILIGILTVMLIALIGGLLAIKTIAPKEETFVVYEMPKEEDDKIKPKPRPEIKPKKPSPPKKTTMNYIVNTRPAELNAPVPDVTMPTPSFDLGTTTEFGNGNGFTPGTNGFNPIPGVPGKRCTDRDRRQRLKETGGSMEGERAVVRALDWLQKTQNEDGSWGQKYKSAMTGFAILAYLGHCEHPYSRKYGETVSDGLTYLIDLGMKNDGKLIVLPDNSIQWVYEHAISTYALAEAQIFCKELKRPFPKLKEVVKDAGDLIIDGQADSGGWNYRYSNSPTQGDNSVGFWQIQALKACKGTSIWKEAKLKSVSRKAIEFLEKVQGQNGAIGYRTDSGRSPHLTGGAVLCMQIWGEGDSRAAKDGIDWVRKNSKFVWGDKSSNLYYHYYNAQAMINEGGDVWDWYNDMFRDQLIEAQKEDGSWSQRMQHGPINDHMATCLATLTLEVYYRFLPGTNN